MQGPLLVDLVWAVVAAWVGGALAHRLRQPMTLGYLLGGMAIGPFTPGPVAHVESVQTLADIGVAFLMFALGAEVSLVELRRVGRVAILGGSLQIVCTMGLGPLLAPHLGLTFVQGIFLGALLALSSTVVVLKLLIDRGELGALHGRVALGILIIQDLAVVPMMLALPAIATGGEQRLTDLASALLKALLILAGAYFIGARVIPWILRFTAVTRTRELFLLSVVVLALGTAMVTQLAGLSLAFGAFLSGLVVAESEYRRQVVAEVLPLRDLFASLFFVSVGMLIDPRALAMQAGLVAALVAVIILIKTAVAGALVLLLGMPARIAVMVGLALAQIGEFSFVLARVGVDRGAIPASLFDLVLATALVTIVLTPSLMRAGPLVLRLLQRFPGAWRLFAEPVHVSPDVNELTRHAVICGYGRVGTELALALDARSIKYLVIDYHPDVARGLADRGVPTIYGDASNPAVLQHAQLDRARLIAVLMPDANAAELATRHARVMNHRLDIVARGASMVELERLRNAGATEVVQPEFEAGQEVIRHALQRFGLGGLELSNLIVGRRAAYYRRLAQAEAE
jgi:CPA2 family monovalent cation:H+ antiporter-2